MSCTRSGSRARHNVLAAADVVPQARHQQHQHAVFSEEAPTHVDGEVPDAVEHLVVAGADRGEVVAVVGDDVVGAESRDQVRVGVARHGGDDRSEVFRELHRVGPDRAGRAVDEHGVAGGDRRRVTQEVQRRRATEEHAHCVLERHTLRHTSHAVGPRDDELGVGSQLRTGHAAHRLARREAFSLGASLFHDPGEGAPQDPATRPGETEHEANERPEPRREPGASDANRCSRSTGRDRARSTRSAPICDDRYSTYTSLMASPRSAIVHPNLRLERGP